MPREPQIRFSRREWLAAVAGLPFLSFQALAQDATFSTDVKVVNVLVSVRDKEGRIVRDLTRDRFTLEEDGRRQEIKYFANQSDLPLTLGLLIDTSGSQRFVLNEERAASVQFVHHILREDRDLAFVIHFDSEIELLQDVTAGKKDLEEALKEAEPSDTRQARRQGRPVAGTTLYDAILLASDEVMRKQAGRKALILMTDGVDQGSRVSLESAIEAAQRADTLVYSILFEGTGGFAARRFGMSRRGPLGGGFPPVAQIPSRPRGDKILRRIAQETGGSYFEVGENMLLEDIFRQIEEELRNQYSLGYTPDHPAKGYRRIKVSVAQKGLKVTAREGYYSD